MRRRFPRRLVLIVGHGGRSVCGTRTWWVGLTVGLHLFASSSPALARPDERPEAELIEIDYGADPSCPTLEDLVARVRTYTTRWALVAEGGAARRFRVELRAREGDAVGTLEIHEARDGGATETSGARTIRGPDCETVARGMAIAVAVAVDPSALLSDRAGEREASAPPPPLPPPPANSEPPSAAREEPPPPRPTAPPPQVPRFAIDARVELTSAVVVGMLPVVSAAIEVEPFAAQRARRLPRWLRPSLALGVRQSSSRSIERSAVTTDFLWTSGVLRLCPARFDAVGDRLEITPCFEGDLGVLRADAKGSTDTRSTTNTWLDVGVSARATWSMGAWFVGGAASMVMPVSRNRFQLSTGTLVSRAPPVGAALGLGAGLRF